MSVATITPAKPAKPAKVEATKPAKPAALTPAEVEAAITAIRDRWASADMGEAAAWKAREAADIAWQNARVVKVRVAYAAAMVTPFKGDANLLNAARILLTDPTATASARTAKAKSTKNTLRNYVDAGAALHAEGLAYCITEPTEQERKIVEAAFKAGNKRDKAEAAAEAAGDVEGVEGTTPSEAPADDEALTVADLVGHVARLQATLNALRNASIVVSEQDAAMVSDMVGQFAAELTEYADGK